MAQAIRLFRNILPNVDNSVHVRYTDVVDYLNFLAPNAVYDLTADNYRLNTNVLKVSLNHFLNYAVDYMEVTYVALEQTLDENYTKYVFYYVKNCYVQSGYVVYMLEEDIWATEQEALNQLKIVVNRCNAKLPNEVGIYDEIKKTETHRLDQSGQLYDTGYTRPLATQKFWNLNMFYVVFVVQWVTSRNLANTDYIKSTNTFAVNLEDLLISMGDPTGHTTFKATDLACMCISGVTKTSTNVWGVTNDAKVIKAFIIPKNEGKIERNLGALSVNFIYRTWLTGNTDKNFNAYELRNTIEYFNYALSLTDFDANYKYYIGTYYNYMQLLNYMHNIDNDRYLNVRYVFMYSQSDVQIFIEQGNEQKDISNGFSIPLIANVEQTDVLQKLCYVADGLKGGLSNVKNVMNSKGYGDLALNVGSAILDNFKFFSGNVNADMGVTDGDGLLVMGYNRDQIRHPLAITYFKSLQDEKYNARVLGLNYNAIIENIDVLDNLTLLGEAPTGQTFNDYYIKGHILGYATAQKDAFEIIKQKIEKGIHLLFVHGS